MVFRYESEMTELVENWLLSQDMQVKREYPTPWGICDLVGCSLNKNKVRKRLSLGQRRPIGSHFRVLLLSYIPDAQEKLLTSLEILRKKFGSFLDEPYIQEELQRLKRDKFIQEVRPGWFHKLNGWYPLHKRIVAVELKLTRISEVVSQAQSNLEFADESYVGLPCDKARHLFESRGSKRLVENGIGIIGVRKTGVRVFLRSRIKRDYNSILKMHCAERFWRTHLRDN